MWYHMYVVLLSAWFAICCTQEGWYYSRISVICNEALMLLQISTFSAQSC